MHTVPYRTTFHWEAPAGGLAVVRRKKKWLAGSKTHNAGQSTTTNRAFTQKHNGETLRCETGGRQLAERK